MCTVAGTTAASPEPTWNTTRGATTSDNTATWTAIPKLLMKIRLVTTTYLSSHLSAVIANAKLDNVWGDTGVSSNEISSGYGYTQGGLLVIGRQVVEDDADGYMQMTCNNITWTANGGPITAGGAILTMVNGPSYYNGAGGTTEESVIGYLDFGGSQTAADGADLTIANIKIRVA